MGDVLLIRHPPFRAPHHTTNTPLPRSDVYTGIVGAKGYQQIAEDDALEITEDDPDLIELDPVYLDR